MSNAEYEVRGAGPLTPIATLSAAVGPGATVFPFTGLMTASTTIVAGVAIMIDDEIVKLVSYTGTTLTVLRGCADTVPAAHALGAAIWFFENASGSDEREYLTGETLSVKVLMSSGSSRLAIADSPPNEIAFVGRALRPYPPANVQVAGAPWWSTVHEIDSTVDTLNVSWVHRDRLLQADVLVGHLEAGIGPEPGTAYSFEAYDDVGDLKGTIGPITGTSTTLERAAVAVALGLFPGTPGVAQATLRLISERDGLTSVQGYEIDIEIDVSDLTLGWGAGWGIAFGE